MTATDTARSAAALLSDRPHSVAKRLRESVRKGRPNLSADEQQREADDILSGLPTLRRPKRPASESPLTVDERKAQFVEKIRGIPFADKMRFSGFAANEKVQLFEFYELTYVRSSLTEYRQAVREAYGDECPAIKYLRLNKADIAGTNAVDRAQVRERNSHLIPINADALVGIALDLLDDGNMYAVAIALVLLTGRRPYEIFKAGVIEKCSTPGHVRFVGQAKLKNAPMTVMTIPVLADVDRVLIAWAKLRNMNRPGGKGRIADLRNARAVNKVTANAMSAITVRYGMNHLFAEPLTPKDLRAAYAEIAYSIFGRRRATKNVYFHDILGHSANDENSTGTYMRFCLEDHAGDAIVQNERAVQAMLLQLFRDREAATSNTIRTQLNDRIAALEAQLSFTGRDTIWRAAGQKTDPAIAAHARRINELADTLSPRQEILVRAIANGISISLSAERRTIAILVTNGILEWRKSPDAATVGLTDLGTEVRSVLPEWNDEELASTGSS